MRKTIYIHVGAGKTGTSALQAFFHANEARLAGQGVVLPQAGRVVTHGQLAHHKLAWHGPHRTETQDEALALWQAAAAQGGPATIVSSEDLHNKISQSDGMAFFREIADRLAGCDLRIVFYIRRQSQWLQSVYAQWVKGNLLTKTFAEFAASYTRNPADQIVQFAEIFGPRNVIVRPFEKGQFEGGDIYRDFCALAGIAWDADFELPRGNPNPRLAGDALELKRQINQFADGPDELRTVLADLLAYSAARDRADSRGVFVTHSLLDPAEQRRIEAENAPKYQHIARTFLGREDGVLFRQAHAAAADPAAEQDAGPVETGQATAYLLLQLYRRLDGKPRRPS